VGAVARLVHNAGLEGLDLVAPGDWRTVECWRTAWGAPDVLEEARVFPDLASALAGTTLAIGFSGRRGQGAPVLDVREAAEEAAGRTPEEAVALVFGPETAGLTRDELALCSRLAAIPSHPRQPSLNLSHAVAIAAYEVFRAARRPDEAPRRASHAEKEDLLALLRAGLLRIGALPEANTDGYFRDWRALVQRTDLTPKEARLLAHLARKLRSPRSAGG
jgi:tRNA/rRNA methyltransferase